MKPHHLPHFLFSCLVVNMALTGSAALPSISFQPKDQRVILYQQAAFGVIASGAAPLAYQWRKDGVPIAGASNDQIVLAHAQFSDAALYSVVVSDVNGSVTSLDAALTVDALKGGDRDFTFGVGLSINGAVNALALQLDGKVLIGGHFTAVNGAIRGGIARLNADGTPDATFRNGPLQNNGPVLSITLQNDGNVIIGGPFDLLDGVSARSLARLHPDGSLDTDFLSRMTEVMNGFVNPSVLSSAVQDDGKVLIAGTFRTVDRVTRTNIRLNADGSLDADFLDGHSGPNGFVESLAIQSDGKVLIGGPFSTVNDVERVGVARLNADGTLDASFESGLSVGPNSINSMALQGDGSIIIGGNFRTVSSSARKTIARLNRDGSLDTNFLSGLSGADNDVYSVAAQGDGRVIIGGLFTHVNGVLRNRIARLNPDGTLDTSFQDGLSGASSVVSSLAIQSDGKVIMGGNFTTVNDEPSFGIARLWGIADVSPLITSIIRSGADVNLIWDALPNRTYRTQFKETVSANNWKDLAGDISATGGTAGKTDTTLGSASLRFYRVVLLP